MKPLIKKIATTTAVLAFSATTALAADVEFMTWTYTEESGKQYIQDMVDTFKEATGKEAEAQGYAWGAMSKNTFLRARTNTLPDISQVQARLLPTLSNLEQIVDLNEVFDRKELEAMFAPGFLAFGEVDGRQVALPWIGGTIGMVANKAVMDKAGVTEVPANVEDFKAALVKVRDSVPNSVPYAMATKNNNSIVLDYLIWVWTFGGDVIDADGKPGVNTPESSAALAFMADLVKERLAAPEIDRPDSRRLFAQEVTAFYFDAPGAKDHIRKFSGQGEAYDVNVLPVKTPVVNQGADPVSIQWGHVLAMYGKENAKADSPAAQFLMHLLSDEILTTYAAEKGVLPSTAAAQASDAIAKNEYLNAWAAASVNPRRNTVASLSNGTEVSAIIGEEVQSALLGQKDAQTAADDMQKRLEEAMAKVK